MKNLLIPFFALILLTACKTDPIEPKPFQNLNDIGNHWLYQYSSNEISQPVYLNVEIIGDTMMDVIGKTARVWEFKLPDRKFLNYVLLEKDTFKMFNHPASSFPDVMIPIHELSPGYSWLGGYCTDTSRVVAYGSHSEQDVDYEEVWSIERKAGYCVNWFMTQNIWWHNDIGFIRMERTDRTFGMPTEEVWELISYN